MDEEEAVLSDTPRRPKPTTLDIPNVRKNIADAQQREDTSPETPSYSSRPLPLSPKGPAIADIPITSPDPTSPIYQNVRKTTADIADTPPPRPTKPSPHLASPENDALTPLSGIAPSIPKDTVNTTPNGVTSRPTVKVDNSSDVDEFNDELQFDSTISSGFGGPGQGDYRSTPITYGVCATPQPTPAKPEGQV